MKFKTIYDDEKALVTNYNGTNKIVEGPCRVCIYFK
jgi:hypothetical protein